MAPYGPEDPGRNGFYLAGSVAASAYRTSGKVLVGGGAAGAGDTHPGLGPRPPSQFLNKPDDRSLVT
jgi:hypothetical protein